jgi:transmembrane sensor
MKYKDYTADDLIKDEYFQQWVFAPNEESNRFWIDYLENFPQSRERVEEARQFLSFFHVKDKDVFESRVSNLKKRINLSIDQPSPENAPLPPVTEKKSAKKMSAAKIRKIVISVGVLIIGIIAVVMGLYPKPEAARLVPAEVSDHRELVSARGKRELVVLGDGSRVFLNADSRISFLKDFNNQDVREVVLEGQAYFEVAENLQKPFIIHTPGLVIKGLAASFSVSAYPESAWIESILVKGKITLESKLHPLNQVVLAPHQRVIFDKGTEAMSFDNQVDAENLTAWRSGRLVFENQSLREIKTTLERWYDVNIEFADESSLGCHFSGQFYNKTIEEVLSMLKTSDEVSFIINGRDIEIKGRLCE